ncbi:MAG TPA: ATP-binding protein [Planctomycetota bacterium]|nr:ATP-binding protein [Planctomycetota bacterium]
MKLRSPRIWSRITAWLRDLPIADDVERRTAQSVQVFLIGLMLVIALGELSTALVAARDYGSLAAWYGPFADLTCLAVSAWSLHAIRSGRPQPAFRLLLSVFVGLLVVSFALRGANYHEHFFVRTYAVLLVLAALLLGRWALWATMASLLLAFGLGELHDHVWSAPLTGLVPAEGQLPRALEIALVLCVLIDRFGVALREAYAASRLREAELEATMRRLGEESDRRSQAESMLIESQRMESLGRLSGGIAHDFNNILTAISGFTGLAQLAVDPAHPAQEHLGQVQVAAGRASALTGQLLAFARRQVVEPRVLDTAERVRRALPLLDHLVGADVEIETNLPAESVCVRIDPTRFEQVLVNLAVNAKDAMPNGGSMRISVATCRDGDRDWVDLTVTDDGVGMDAETARHVFEPFFTTKRHGKGTGLGLATCHGIVHQAGGSVSVQSSPGRGTTLRVRLPRIEAPPETVDQGARDPVARRTRGESILVIDDDAQIRRIVSWHLERAGYRVHVAESAAEARTMVERDALTPDLLLTDVVMPDEDGPGVAQWLQRLQPSARVLYMSGHTEELVTSHRLDVPAIDLLQKPFTLEELLARVDGVLAATGRDAARPSAST